MTPSTPPRPAGHTKGPTPRLIDEIARAIRDASDERVPWAEAYGFAEFIAARVDLSAACPVNAALRDACEALAEVPLSTEMSTRTPKYSHDERIMLARSALLSAKGAT